MSSEARAEGLRKSMEAMVGDLDKKHMRPLQKEAYGCMAKCCDSADSQADLQRCCGGCEQRVQMADQMVNATLRDFQDRLQRCVQRCQDRAQEKLPASPSDKEIEKAQKMLGDCAADCAQEYEKQVPKLKQDILTRLKQLK